MDRRDFFFKQQVTEGEMDEAFDDVELADQRLVTDYLNTGVLTNGDVTEHSPTADLTVDINNPSTVYDTNGQRIFWAASQRIDTSKNGETPIGGGGNPDVPDGSAIALPAGGNEKIITIVAKFARILSDPRTDGLGATIQYDRIESFRYEVLEGAEESIPATTFPTVPSGAMVLDHYRLQSAQTQIFNADLFATLEPGNSQRSDFVGIGTHIATTQDPHSSLQTVTGRMLIGATGAPVANEILGVVGGVGDFFKIRSATDGMSFVVDMNGVPIVDMQSKTTVTGVEQSYFRIRDGAGTIVYINARGILGAASGTGNGTRVFVDEANKVVDIFSGTEASQTWDVGLQVFQLGLGTHGGPPAAGRLIDARVAPSAAGIWRLADDFGGPATARYTVDLAGTSMSFDGPSGEEKIGFDMPGPIGAPANPPLARFRGIISPTSGGFVDSRFRISDGVPAGDEAGDWNLHSGTEASPTYNRAFIAGAFEPREDHFDTALTADQFPQMGRGRLVMAHGRTLGATGAIQAGHVNISSGVRNSVGDYTMNFDQSFSSTDYSIVIMIDGSSSGFIRIKARTLSSFTFQTLDSSDVLADREVHFIIVGRD